jgi:hypothetical protein
MAGLFPGNWPPWLASVFLVGFACLLLIEHFFLRSRDIVILTILFLMILVIGIAFVVEVATQEKVLLLQLVSLTIWWGAAQYVVICDIFLLWLANFLTKVRGDKWIKEMDYFYLLIGALGVVISVSRLEIVSDKLSGIDIIGPLVVTTALVLRLVKTRADIGGWNKGDLKSGRRRWINKSGKMQFIVDE